MLRNKFFPNFFVFSLILPDISKKIQKNSGTSRTIFVLIYDKSTEIHLNFEESINNVNKMSVIKKCSTIANEQCTLHIILHDKDVLLFSNKIFVP